MFVNSKSNNNSLFYKIFSIKNLLFFKIVTNRYLEHENSPYYNRSVFIINGMDEWDRLPMTSK